jgi:long-subunit acyl-CoA synthetase (AMP-forming)
MSAGVMLQVMGAIAQSSPVARKLFHLAYESKRAALKQGDLSGGRFGPLWDRLVFSKVRARLGGGFAERMRSSMCPLQCLLRMQHYLASLIACRGLNV